MKAYLPLAFFLILIAPATVKQAEAAEIVLYNGDRITGKVMAMEAGKLVLERLPMPERSLCDGRLL